MRYLNISLLETRIAAGPDNTSENLLVPSDSYNGCLSLFYVYLSLYIAESCQVM